jgi:hypothetical protein
MKNLFFAGLFATLALSLSARLDAQGLGIGIQTPDISAQLDISSAGRGLLIPRMNTAGILAIGKPAKGLLVYDSLRRQLMVNMGSPTTPDWQNITANSSWSLTGNGHTKPSVNFIGTLDPQSLQFKVNKHWSGIIDSATNSTYLGYATGRNSSATPANTAFGSYALGTDYNGTGFNTALGSSALAANISGYYNTAVGAYSLFNNISGNSNTAVGHTALAANTVGSQNTAIGARALHNNLMNLFSADYNTAIGTDALFSNSSGVYNTAIGAQALYTDPTGSWNTVAGQQAVPQSYGNFTTAVGYQSMNYQITGDNNTTMGALALDANSHISGSPPTVAQNTSVGYQSLLNNDAGNWNTALGYTAGIHWRNGWYNCFIGSETDLAVDNCIFAISLGHGTICPGSGTMRVGNTATTSIGGPVGWSTISDGRVKKNIRENIPGLAFINKLRPITYNIDPAAIDAIVKAPKHAVSPLMTTALKAKGKIVYTGFAAQEVEQAARSVNYDFHGVHRPQSSTDLYNLCYESLVTPLVRSVQELATLDRQLNDASRTLKQQFDNISVRLDALEKKIH